MRYRFMWALMTAWALAGSIDHLPAWQTEHPAAGVAADAARQALRELDERVDSRWLSVERTFQIRSPGIELWRLPDLRDVYARTPGLTPPESLSIQVRSHDEFAWLGRELAHRRRILDSDLPARSGLLLEPLEHLVLTQGRERSLVAAETVGSKRSPFPFAGGPAVCTRRYVETLFTLGVGYGHRIRHIDRWEPMKTGGCRIAGRLALWPGVTATFVADFDPDWIARRAVVRMSEGPATDRELTITTRGLVGVDEQFMIAESGEARWRALPSETARSTGESTGSHRAAADEPDDLDGWNIRFRAFVPVGSAEHAALFVPEVAGAERPKRD